MKHVSSILVSRQKTVKHIRILSPEITEIIDFSIANTLVWM
jgi:hypothetical protein